MSVLIVLVILLWLLLSPKSAGAIAASGATVGAALAESADYQGASSPNELSQLPAQSQSLVGSAADYLTPANLSGLPPDSMMVVNGQSMSVSDILSYLQNGIELPLAPARPN
jgi:hypothetical protein